ncbi:hypothetical protein ACZ90_14655 [Streptomyces albus subsp. albus]|nr:hypothetical protein ACZ90_14655 [Streptomyces albus subsp. albus]
MGKAIRLTFEYRGRDVELVSSEPVDAIVPGSPAEPGDEPPAGYRIDVLDSRGERVHSRRLHDPMPQYAEFAHAADPDRPFTRSAIPEPGGRFFVLVPALEDETEVALLHRDQEGGETRTTTLLRARLPRSGEKDV